MDRESILYKIRRKMQVLAYYILPSKTLSGIYYRILIHDKLNLDNPKTFNEKLQWLKLYYFPNNPLAVQCTDKYQVRDYIERKGYGDRLTKLIGVWENVEDIPWDKLPDKFVLKCTHGCAYNILCSDKKTFDINDAKKKLKGWLKQDFAAFNVELHYGKIKPRRIICEEYLGDMLIDYKFFCFNGEPKFYYVSSDLVHDRQAEISFFDMNGERIPLIRDDYRPIGDMKEPACYKQMVQAAKDLSADFPFVRVDFFLIGDSYNFAELTFTPAAAMMPLNPRKYDVEWGNLLNLDKIK